MLNASNFEFFAQGRPSFINLSARYSSLRQCMSATPSLMSRAMLVSALSCKEEEYHVRRWQIGASLSAFRIFNEQKKQ